MSWSTAGQVENEESVHQFNLLSQEQHTGMGMSMDWKASVLTPTAKKIKKKNFICHNFLFSGLHVRKIVLKLPLQSWDLLARFQTSL